MIKPSALAMGVVMASLAAGTYYGLSLLPPGLLPPPIGRAIAQENGPTTKAAEPIAVAEATPEAAPAPAGEEAPTEQDLAEDPAPAESAPPEQADAASAEAEPAPAPAPTPAPTAAAPAPKPAPAPAKTEPKTEVASAAPAPKPAPKAEAPAPKPAPAPAKTEPPKTEVASAAPATKEPAKAPPAADVIKPWWPDPSKMPPNQLKLQYAGQVKGQPAIALLFSAPLKLESVQKYSQVKNAKGEAVSAQWTAGKNPALAVLNGLEPGRYTVILQPQIADQKGFMLGATLKGPVYIKEP